MQAVEEHTIEIGSVNIGQSYFQSRVVRRELEPRLPCFVGTVDRIVFVSEEVPVTWRQYVLEHEAMCNFVRGNEVGGCRKTTVEEVASVPSPERSEYVYMRIRFYNALLTLQSDHPLRSEIEPSLEYLRSFQERPEGYSHHADR